jgi:hypothetical protein
MWICPSFLPMLSVCSRLIKFGQLPTYRISFVTHMHAVRFWMLFHLGPM